MNQLTLLANPRIGRRVEAPEPHEVRRLLVGAYELRYEIQGSTIFIVRMSHTREDRKKEVHQHQRCCASFSTAGSPYEVVLPNC